MCPSAVTIVGHDATRTGAPGALRALLAPGIRPPRTDVRIVLLRGGPLEAEYRALAPTVVLDRGAGRIPSQMARALTALGHAGAASRVRSGRTRTRRGRGDHAVVANTLASLPEAVGLTGPDGRLVLHTHELDAVADRTLPEPDRTRLLTRVDHHIAAGPAVARMLIDRWNIPPDAVTTIDEFVDRAFVAAPDDTTANGDERRRAARARLGIADDRPLIVSIGAAGHRKGTDLFISLVADLARRHPGLIGAWIGGERGAAWDEAVFDLEASGLGERVRLVPTVNDPTDWFDACDLAVSTAREDPYPIAVLEAGARGRPVAAMRSGGVGDMLVGAGSTALLADAGDVLDLARRVEAVLDGAEGGAEAVGSAFAGWVAATHLTEHWAPAWWAAVLDRR